MKKGLVLSLMMVAMVALTVPAFAVAPVIQSLPSVIVGDSEGAQASPPRKLMLYANAFNIAEYVIGQNGNAQSALHIYYADDGDSPIVASTESRLVQPVTSSTLTDLVDSGILPSNDLQVTNELGTALPSDYYWMSLVNLGINPSATSAYGQDVAAVGTDPASYDPADLGAEVLTLYAADTEDTSTTPDLIASDEFIVYSVADSDDGYSMGVITRADLSGSALHGWHVNAASAPITSTSTDGLVITASTTNASKEIAQWQSGVGGDPAALVTGVTEADAPSSVYRMRLTLSTSGVTDALLCPRYRLIYFSERNHVLGGIIYQSNDLGASSLGNLPTDGTDKTPSVCWAAPFDLTQMGDGELLSDPSSLHPDLDGVGDVRDYIVEWSVIDQYAADGGVMTLKNVLVQEFERPADATPDHEWGGSGDAFNATGKMWYGSPLGGTWTDGTFTMAGDGSYFTITGGNSPDNKSFMQANPFFNEDGVADIGGADNTLNRITVDLSASDDQRTPIWRVYTAVAQDPTTNANLLAGSIFGSVGLRSAGSIKSYMDVEDGATPCSPKEEAAGGSTVDVYLYMNDAPDTALLVPQIMTVTKPNRYGGDDYTGTSDLPVESGVLKVTGVTVETDLPAPF